MEVVIPAEESCLSYPDVVQNARLWVYSDKKPDKETITVTVHGLRRLLRVARQSQFVVMHAILGKKTDLYADDNTPGRLASLANELSKIWCEDDVVMSRLFVTDDGKACAHPDKEIDDAGIPPWECGRADG